MWKNMKDVYLVLMVFSLAASLSRSQQPHSETGQQNDSDTLKTVSQEQVNKIAHQLMAPCCWSETADVHQSPAAEEVKAQIHAALQRGYTEQKILDGFVAAYGERILAKPKAAGFNLLVWILPAIAIIIGGFGAWRYLSQARVKTAPKSSQATTAADEDYEQRLEQELEEFDS